MAGYIVGVVGRWGRYAAVSVGATPWSVLSESNPVLRASSREMGEEGLEGFRNITQN